MKRMWFLYNDDSMGVCSPQFCIVSIFLIVLAGCSSAPEAKNDSSHIPSVGSQFTSEVQHRVGSDRTLRSETVRFSVQVTDMIVEGKEQVVQFAADTLLSLIAYESNGDLSIYMSQGEFGGCRFNAAWLRFPFGAGEPVTDTLAGTDESVVIWNARPSGEERVIIDDRSFYTTKVLAELRTGGMLEGSATGVSKREYLLWYAPELGYVVREHIVSLVDIGDQTDTVGVSERELTEYVITDEQR